MGARGSGRYARGYNALAICERSGKKMLRRKMVYDGQFPDLLVAPDEWDPKHPQEYLPEVTDPITLYDPTGDPDRFQANMQVVQFPALFSDDSNPLSIGVVINSGRYNWQSGAIVDA